jgi:hypothetical protein
MNTTSSATQPETEEFLSFQTLKELEKLFSVACLNLNLPVAQLLFETGQVKPSIAGRAALRLWNADAAALRLWNAEAAAKNRTDGWKSMMRWLLMLVVKQETDRLGTCIDDGWREMTTAWARGEFN